MATPPNILLVLTDDQRFDTIAALGNPLIETPVLDGLVAAGTAFTQAAIPCGTCGAVCMPSRAMLHTGRELFSLQGSGAEIPADHTTLGEHLRAHGYRCFGTGKWHNGRAAFHRSFDAGDEIFFGGMADHWNVPAYRFDPGGRYDATLPRCVDPLRSKELEQLEADHITAGLHSSQMVCDAAARWLETYDADAPFLCSIAFLAPHDPRTMPQRFRERYDPADIPLPPNFAGSHPFDTGRLYGRDECLIPHPRDPDLTREHIADYYAMITHLDEELGRVLAVLDRRGLRRDTIVVVAGDNGLALGQHGLFGKQNCYQHSVRVPLLVSGPGAPAGQRCDTPCYLLDLFPTLCDLCGLPTPASVQGRSLAPCLRDARHQVRDELLYAFIDTQRAISHAGWKLIDYAIDGRHSMTQLFDLERDPWEMDNRAAAEPDRVHALRARLRRMATAWGDHHSGWGQRFWSALDA